MSLRMPMSTILLIMILAGGAIGGHGQLQCVCKLIFCFGMMAYGFGAAFGGDDVRTPCIICSVFCFLVIMASRG